jgi:hypothetical protein
MRMPDAAGLPVTNPLPPHHQPDAGWSEARRGKFLALLAESGNVRGAALACGLSPQSAYKLRRREPGFARAWLAAILLARDHTEQVLADRALLGVEEPVFYRGEQVGVRRRYDTRLLLAHMARLDALADESAMADAARFDELVALAAGERFAVPGDDDGPDEPDLPLGRGAFAESAAKAACAARDAALPEPFGDEEWDRRDAQIAAAGDTARTRAAASWDEWYARACARVDAATHAPMPLHRVSDSPLLARPGLRAWTLSTVSTNGLAMGLMGGVPMVPAKGGSRKIPHITEPPPLRRGDGLYRMR